MPGRAVGDRSLAGRLVQKHYSELNSCTQLVNSIRPIILKKTPLFVVHPLGVPFLVVISADEKLFFFTSINRCYEGQMLKSFPNNPFFLSGSRVSSFYLQLICTTLDSCRGFAHDHLSYCITFPCKASARE